jgi:hypothetical protein
MKRLFVYDPANPRREDVLAFACDFIRQAGQRLRIEVGEPKRSLEQNDRMWALLTDISEQVQWPVDGRMQRLSPEDWKHILSAGLKREHRVAQGIDGGFVLLGQRTSKMTKRELSELMELIAAFGAERGVEWSEPKARAA